ncbi:lysostaphin resistance A-like protein [Nonlabens sp.]|uniref:CPBP family intramembrane glutamic endopeptidase n=1 Tax=Nonlabens sp. TaxID=1888209 RepID=UPI003F69C636
MIFFKNEYATPIGLPDISNSLLFFIACIIMPAIEEFGFRGFIFKNNYLSFLSILSLLIFFVFLQNFIIIAVVVVLLILQIVRLKYKISVSYQLVISSFIFGLVHYQIPYENISVENILPVFFHSGMGLVFAIVFVNYGYLRSFIVHTIYNSIIFVFVIASEDKKLFEVMDQTETIQYHIKELEQIPNKLLLYQRKDSTGCESCKIKEYLTVYGNDIYNNETYRPLKSNTKYDLLFKSEEIDLNDSDNPLKILEEHGLIVPK